MGGEQCILRVLHRGGSVHFQTHSFLLTIMWNIKNCANVCVGFKRTVDACILSYHRLVTFKGGKQRCATSLEIKNCQRFIMSPYKRILLLCNIIIYIEIETILHVCCSMEPRFFFKDSFLAVSSSFQGRGTIPPYPCCKNVVASLYIRRLGVTVLLVFGA